ncbi:MAG: hypothetical protein AB8I08_12750 [Sandaracinaceae bacterium]
MFALVATLLARPALAQGEGEHDPRPRVVETRPVPPSPAVAAQIADLEDRQRAAEGRATGFGGLTLGGTALLIGGVVAMTVIAAIGPMDCMGPECVTPVEDFAPGLTLSLIGAAALLTGGILWGEADANAADLRREIERLRGPTPTFSLGPNGGSVGLVGRF